MPYGLIASLISSSLCFAQIIFMGAILAVLLMLFMVRVIYQYERGILFTLGKYTKTLNPGVNFVIPFIQRLVKVDMRIKTVDIPKQEVMTKDNVPVSVDAVVYFRVEEPEAVILEIKDYVYAVAQYSRTAMRDIIGNMELDTVLTKREKIAHQIKELVDRETSAWGVDITAIKIQDIELPMDMKRAMARQAEAEREKRATIIKSEGEVKASHNLAEAAMKLSESPGALHLRTLQTICDVSPDQSNTIIFVMPIEVLEALKGYTGAVKRKKGV